MHRVKRLKTKAGTFLLEFSKSGLARVSFPKRPPRDHRMLAGLTRKLKKEKLDLSGCTAFEKKVYSTLAKVPAGKVITYGDLAKKAGYPNAARAVGSAMKKNRLPVVIPCHRVVPAGGGIGNYSAGAKWKRLLLEHEQSHSATKPHAT